MARNEEIILLLNSKLSHKVENFKRSFGVAIIAIIILLIVVKGFEFINPFYYLIIPLLLVNILSEAIIRGKSDSKLEFTIYFLPFIIWILLSYFWSIHPEVTFKRVIYFTFLVIGMESLSRLLPNKVNALIKVFSPTIIIVVAISMLSLITGVPSDYWSGGNGLGLKGFATHQNMLGSMMLVIISILNYNLYSEFKEERVRRKNIILLFIANFMTIFILLTTFSRAAILSYLVFGFTWGLFDWGIKKTLIAMVTLVIVFLLLSRIELINEFFDYSVYKGYDSLLSSRESVYKGSWEAAKNGGFFGLGYGVSDPTIVDGVPGRFINGVFIREKGSTLLALIEEVGALGAILFYMPVGMVLIRAVRRKRLDVRGEKLEVRSKRLEVRSNEEKMEKLKDEGIINIKNGSLERISEVDYRKNNKYEREFLIAAIIAMTVHSQFEAWGVGVGSVMLPVCFLFLFRLEMILE